jgi:hypothetical protein
VFTQPTSGWANATQTAELTASDPNTNTVDELGSSVGVSGTTITAGAPYHTANGSQQGAVYVFTQPTSGWVNATQTAELTASDGAGDARLGYSVSVTGTTITAGAPFHTVHGHTSQGAVYVFTQPTSGWTNATQTAELTASDGTGFDELGSSVGVSGTTITAGAPYRTVNGNAGQGAVYVFTQPTSGWANATQTAELTASDGAGGDDLGYSVGVSGTTIAGGARLRTVNGNADQGAVSGFTQPTSGWADATQTAELTAGDGAGGDDLGTSVGVSGTTITAGAPYHTVNANQYQGAAYVFGPSSVLPTSVGLSCSPGTLQTGTSTACTATVSDLDTTSTATPTGTVGFASNGAGTFTPAASCTLAGTGSSASCAVSYSPVARGSQTITATYAGDPGHTGGSGQATVLAYVGPLPACPSGTSPAVQPSGYAICVRN